MDVSDIQEKIMTSTGVFYPQSRLSYCIEITKRDLKIDEDQIITELLNLYHSEEMAADSSAIDILRCLYILKHDNASALSKKCQATLRKAGMTLKSVDILEEEYEYAYFDISKGDYESLSPVEQLQRAGVTTVEIIPPESIEKYQGLFDNTLRNFPEYHRDPNDPDLDSEGNPLVYVAGGFAALGNPASFHNELSRNLRKKGYRRMKELMKGYVNNLSDKEKYNIQALSDRMMYRQKGQQPSAEAWHRDVMPPDKIFYEDEIFGGWINLDSVDQYFSCIPGSHANVVQKTLDAGFATLTDAVTKIYRKQTGEKPSVGNIKNVMSSITKDRHRFRVPPGHMIIFPQYILHEVVANKAKYNMRRQFTGWRLTLSDKPLYPLEMFDQQAVIPLPGGMIPPMYAKLHLVNWKVKRWNLGPDTYYNLLEWSIATFKEGCLEKIVPKKGEPYIVVQRHMESLEEYQFPLYPPYLQREKRIYEGETVI